MIKTTCSTLLVPAKLKVLRKASPVYSRNYPREYSRVAYCVRSWIPTIKYLLGIRKPRYLNLRNCPLPRRMSWWSPWWLSQDASRIDGKLQKGFSCTVMRSGHLLGLVEKPSPFQGYSTGLHTQDHPAVLESSINQLLSCFACKTLAHGSAQQPLRCHLLSHRRAEPDVVSWAPLCPGWATSTCLCRQGAILPVTRGELGKEEFSWMHLPAVQLHRTRS